MSDEILSLSTTEDELSVDKDGSVKRSLINQLEQEIAVLKKPQKESLSPDDFKKKESIIVAMEESIKVIEMTWAKYHLGNKKLH